MLGRSVYITYIVNRWQDYFSIFSHFQKWKFAHKHIYFTKTGSIVGLYKSATSLLINQVPAKGKSVNETTNACLSTPPPLLVSKLFASWLSQWGTAASTFVYFMQLSPSGGAFLAEMAGQQTGLNGRETKLAWRAGQKNNLKETSRGHLVCVKKTNNVKKGAWLFFPIFHLLNFVERVAKYSTYLYKGSCQVFGFTYVSLVIVFGTKG